ncbi:MAG: phosphoribosyltransferase family protein, partial [Pseudomonadota bacterium]
MSFENTSEETIVQKHRKQLLSLLKEHAYEEREIVLSSGRKSDFYIDCRKVVLTAEGHFLVGWLFCHFIRKLCSEAVAVGGMSLGANPLASSTSVISYLQAQQLEKESAPLYQIALNRIDPVCCVARCGASSLRQEATPGAPRSRLAYEAASYQANLVLDAFFVRKEAKTHGTEQFVEGASHLPHGASVVIVEDVITTGHSCMLAVNRAKEVGLQPVRVIGLVDRCEGGREFVEQHIPLTTI